MLPRARAHPLDGSASCSWQRRSARAAASEAELAVGDPAAGPAVRERFGACRSTPGSTCCPRPDGPVLIELELTEPSLFLGHAAARPTGSPPRSLAAAA